ncbi:hypothetical protein Tco_0140976 [Tanacetum coccineum]
MASMNTRLNIDKLDGNIVQKHGGSKQAGFYQLGPCVKTGVHGVHVQKCVWFEVKLQGAQENHEFEVIQESDTHDAVAKKVKVPGQDGTKGNAAEMYRGDSNMVALGVVAAEIWVTKGFPDEAKEIILGMEIFRTRSEGGLSRNRDEEKKNKVSSGYCYLCLDEGGLQSEVSTLVEAVAYQRRLTIITKVEIVRILVCNS